LLAKYTADMNDGKHRDILDIPRWTNDFVSKVHCRHERRQAQRHT